MTAQRFRPLLFLLLASCATAGPPPTIDFNDPTAAILSAPGPEQYRVLFETSEGNFVLEANRAWAPLGADRFYNLVRLGFFNDVRFFRVEPGFVVQFGISGDTTMTRYVKTARIPDDPVVESNTRGTITFATAGPNTRTSQVFINLVDNSRLDRQGFAPFGRIVTGMEVVDSLYSGYFARGRPDIVPPDQLRIESEGNAYLEAEFPELDHIIRASVVEE